MGKGLIDPAASAISGRGKQIDSAVDEATAVKTVAAAPDKAYVKPITSAEAEANQARRKAANAAEETTRAMPKPGVLGRLKKMFTDD